MKINWCFYKIEDPARNRVPGRMRIISAGYFLNQTFQNLENAFSDDAAQMMVDVVSNYILQIQDQQVGVLTAPTDPGILAGSGQPQGQSISSMNPQSAGAPLAGHSASDGAAASVLSPVQAPVGASSDPPVPAAEVKTVAFVETEDK